MAFCNEEWRPTEQRKAFRTEEWRPTERRTAFGGRQRRGQQDGIGKLCKTRRTMPRGLLLCFALGLGCDLFPETPPLSQLEAG
ncbi:MAG: hypothetical protein CVU63_20475, partial [Deltaproteobacteria bacterium HGW-Deltaproteobacteria-20]